MYNTVIYFIFLLLSLLLQNIFGTTKEVLIRVRQDVPKVAPRVVR